MKTSLRFGLIVAILLTIVACSARARIPKLVASTSDFSIENRHKNNVSVTVIGGDEQFVSSSAFAEALVNSLNSSKVFANASTTSSSGDYDLIVIITSAIHGALWYNHYISAKWILKDADGSEIWSDTIKAKGHSNYIGGLGRSQRSAERAAKSVIMIGVSKLSSLELK